MSKSILLLVLLVNIVFLKENDKGDEKEIFEKGNESMMPMNGELSIND